MMWPATSNQTWNSGKTYRCANGHPNATNQCVFILVSVKWDRSYHFSQYPYFIYLLFQHSMLALEQNSLSHMLKLMNALLRLTSFVKQRNLFHSNKITVTAETKILMKTKTAIVDRTGRTMLFIRKINNFWFSIMDFNF